MRETPKLARICGQKWAETIEKYGRTTEKSSDPGTRSSPFIIFLTKEENEDYDDSYVEILQKEFSAAEIQVKLLSSDPFHDYHLESQREAVEGASAVLVAVRMGVDNDFHIYALCAAATELKIPVIYLKLGTQKEPPAWFINLMETEEMNVFEFYQVKYREEIAKKCVVHIKKLLANRNSLSVEERQEGVQNLHEAEMEKIKIQPKNQ